MNKIFVRTKNVKNFIALTKRLKFKPENVPRMALVFGEPGLGKSHTAIWWAVRNDAIYIRCSNNMSSRWLLDNIVENLGETPLYSTADLMKQAENLLLEVPKVLIIDEIDHILNSGKVIETVRDIYDKTNTPVILMGMNKADKKLKHYRHIYDRVSEILKFEPFSYEEIKNIVDQLSEVSIEEDALNLIYQNSNRLRQVVSLISRAEELARANNINSVNAELLKNGANKLIEARQ
jgi:Cdc6-like AAA superfamily ATPase